MTGFAVDGPDGGDDRLDEAHPDGSVVRARPGREGLVRRTALVRRVDAQFSRRVRGIASGLGMRRNVVVGQQVVRRGAPGATFTIWAPGQAGPRHAELVPITLSP